MAEPYTVGSLAHAAGVNVETVRFYHRRGLLPRPPRPYGSVRRYGEADLGRLRFIRRAQQLGFSLDEVGALLQLNDGRSCGTARSLAERKLGMIDERLRDLTALRTELLSLVRKCRSARGRVRCPLIDALSRS